MAETIVFGDADDHGDLRMIESLMARFSVFDQDVAAARARARKLVVLHWQKIEAVAAALLVRGVLSGTEIDAAVKK
ncbi:MAG: hypothetical protein WAV38_35730 [Xanthobacteraceae bacterium]